MNFTPKRVLQFFVQHHHKRYLDLSSRALASLLPTRSGHRSRSNSWSSGSQILLKEWKMSSFSLPKSGSSSAQRNESLLQPEGAKTKLVHTQTDTESDIEMTNIVEADGWLNIGAYSVFAWSISGVESCIVIKAKDLQVVFDIGIAVKESVSIPNVFVTHGHTDHIGGLVNHVSKRGLYGMKPARYYVPPQLVEPLKSIMASHYQMAETIEALDNVNIQPISVEDSITISSSYFVKTFPTYHRINSQGYIVYKQEKKLRAEYRGLPGFEVAALHRNGVDIHEVIVTPEIAYTGDTIFDVFTDPPSPDILKVKLLITEATFLEKSDKEGNCTIEKARTRGHIHLQEFVENTHLFNDIGHLLLVHFSNKYPPKYICDSIRDQIPAPLKYKVIPATVASATKPTNYF